MMARWDIVWLLSSPPFGLFSKIVFPGVEGASSAEAAARESKFSEFPVAKTLGGPASLLRLTRRDYGAMQFALRDKFSFVADDPYYAGRGGYARLGAFNRRFRLGYYFWTTRRCTCSR